MCSGGSPSVTDLNSGVSALEALILPKHVNYVLPNVLCNSMNAWIHFSYHWFSSSVESPIINCIDLLFHMLLSC